MSTQLPVLENGKYVSGKEQFVRANNTYDDSSQDDEIDLRELFFVLRRRKGTIFLTTLLIFIIGFIVTLRIQPTYKATATIQIDSEASKKILDFDIGMPGGSSDNEFFQTQYELLKSRVLAGMVIDELQLNEEVNTTENTTSLSKTVITYLRDLVTLESEVRPVYALGSYPEESKFLEGLSITPVKKSQIVSISYTSHDPQFATDAANTTANSFIKLTSNRRDESGESARDYINNELKTSKAELQKLEESLANYAKKESIVQVGGEQSQSLVSQKTMELNLAAAKAEAQRIEAEALYRQMGNSQSASRVLNNRTIQEYKGQLTKLENEYVRDLKIYKKSHPRMISLKRQINVIDARLNREISSVTETSKALIKDKYLAADRKEKALKAELEEQTKGLLEEKDKSIEYQSLLRNIGIKRKVYEGLLLRSIEINIASGVATSNVAVVDAAILPYAQQTPNLKLNLALGSVLGLFMGVVISFLLEFMDDRVKSSEDLKRILGLPILGVTPEVKGYDPIKHSLTTAHEPSSALAEAFRSFRTNLLFSSAEGVPKVLALTSAMPSEGKSSSCLNLATAFAQSGNKVLVVDADMRKPTVHKRLKLNNSKGLSNYLTQQEKIDDVIQESIITGVSAITAGPLSPSPSELLSSQHLEGIFKLAPSRFDIIILDCPPVMGLADALILANKANATVLVSAFGQTSKRAIQDAHERLTQARANLIGTLFSKVKSGGGYGYEYSAYYNYGADKLSN